MRVRWLGWAGVEVQSGDARLLIDPLVNPAAVFAAAGERAAGVTLPELADPFEGAPVAAALVTHLHRDHADTQVLAAGMPVYGPQFYPGADALADAGIAQARDELAAAGVSLVATEAWTRFELGPFTVTALPAADGTGDPQLSWAVEADGCRIVHCGDTLFHGWWWRAARLAGPFDVAFLPINGAVLDFPWRQPPSPLPGAMAAEQAVVAARALSARIAVPMHYGAFDFEPFYRAAPVALVRFTAAAQRDGVTAVSLRVGGVLDVEAAPAAA